MYVSNLFGILNVSKQGMKAQSFAINTTSHNISNANTKGFSRQRVNMQATLPYTYPGVGQLGTGVEIDGVQRIRDEFLDSRICYEVSINGKYEAAETVLEQVEVIFLEPSDTGLSNSMKAMWNSWTELSNYPEQSNTKTVTANTSKTFADQLNHMAFQLDTLKADTITTLEGKTYNANRLIEQIQEISDQIYKLSIKELSPNDLLDQRDLMVEELSAIINIDVEYDEFSRMKITEADSGSNRVLLEFNTQSDIPNEMSVIRDIKDVGGGNEEITVVRGGESAKTFTFTVASGTYSEGEVVYADPNEWEAYEAGGTPPPAEPTLIKVHMREGELAGYNHAIDKINEYHQELDQLAHTIAVSVNMIHSDKGSSIDFFDTSDASATFTAKNIQVNTNIIDDVSKINAAKDILNPKEGDGARALAIAQIRDATLQLNHDDFKTYLEGQYDAGTMEVTSDSAGTTFDGYYKDVIAKLGIDTQQAHEGVDSQATLLLQLKDRRESISGVNIDEEVATLIQFQNSYQANARVITTLTEMLDTLINRMGL